MNQEDQCPMSSSNMFDEAEKRKKRHWIEECKYWGLNTFKEWLDFFDELITKNTGKVDSILIEKRSYVKHMILNEVFFKPLDKFFSNNKEFINSFISTQMNKVPEWGKEIYLITLHASCVYFYMIVNFALNEMKKNKKNDLSSLSKSFFIEYQDLINKYSNSKGATGNDIYSFLIDSKLESDFNWYWKTEILKEIFWENLSLCLDVDIKNNLLEKEELFDINLMYKTLNNYIWPDKKGPTFTDTLWNYTLSFQILYAMVWSVAEYFSLESGFSQLTDYTKKKMFYSIKADLLLNARFLTKRFANDNEEMDKLWSILHFGENTSKIPHDMLIFNFQKHRIFLDWKSYLEEPKAPEKTHIHRWCPVAFISGEWMTGSFLSRQITTALDVYRNSYLSKK